MTNHHTTPHPDYPPPSPNDDPQGDRCICGGIRHWHADDPYGCDDCDCTSFRLVATHLVHITADGTVTRLVGQGPVSAQQHAAALIGDKCTVVALHRNPTVDRFTQVTPLVAYIDDWGATNSLPINRKVWAMYGRGPIHGDAVVCYDYGSVFGDQQALSETFIAMVSSPLTDWGIEQRVLDTLLAEPDPS